MGTENVLDVIHKRRTIRRYTAEDVSDEQVRQLLVAAQAAPSVMNRRPWHFVVSRDPKVKKLVAEGLRIHPYVEQAPVLIIALADTSLSPAWRLDLSAAVENIHLAAAAMGLGSAWIGSPDTALEMDTEDKLREVLCLPDEVKLFAFVAVGHPSEQRPPHEFDPYFVSTHVHYDTWEGLKF